MEQFDKKNGNSSSENNLVLGSIARGGSIVLVGMICNLGFQFILQILIISNITQSQFGLFSLALATANILSIICLMGFDESLPAYVSAKMKKGKPEEAMGGLKTGYTITLSLSLSLSILLFLAADLAAGILGKPELAPVLRIFSLIIPLKALLGCLRAILRSFELAFGATLFQDIVRPLSGVLFVLGAIYLDFTFIGINVAFALSFFIGLVGMGIFVKARLPKLVSATRTTNVSREAVLFALPMLGAGLSVQLLMWIDTFMLSWFNSAKDVGLYNAALVFRPLLLIPLLSIVFTYLPIASRLFADDNLSGMRQTYATVTKWGFALSLPFFFFFTIAPNLTLNLTLGSEFAPASTTLRLIALSAIVHVMTGPNGQTLVAIGKPQLVFYVRITAVAINLVANTLLIPKYGIEGAATATLISMMFSNLLLTHIVYRLCGVQPFFSGYIRLIIISFFFALCLYYSYTSEFITNPVILGTCCILSIPLLVASAKCVSIEDAKLLALLELKLTGEVRIVKKLFPAMDHKTQVR